VRGAGGDVTTHGNVEVVRRTFEAYSRGDYDEAASCLDPDVVWEVGQEMPALGRAAVRAMWERWDSAWEEMETVPEDFLEAGDHVVVTVHYKARGRGSGIGYDERLFDVYTMRDGLCVRKVEFRTRAEALRAAGMVP
jgi:ketosteroid isomerase-like protein